MDRHNEAVKDSAQAGGLFIPHKFKSGLYRQSYGENDLDSGLLSIIEKATDSLIHDSEKITYYLNVDQQTDSVSLETNLVSNQGSLISDAAAADIAMGPSMFGGFQNDINSAMHKRFANLKRVSKTG